MKIITIISTLAVIFLLLFFVAEMKISFSPFKITFERPYYALGWVLICLGISFIQIDSAKKAKKELIKDVYEAIDNAYENKK